MRRSKRNSRLKYTGYNIIVVLVLQLFFIKWHQKYMGFLLFLLSCIPFESTQTQTHTYIYIYIYIYLFDVFKPILCIPFSILVFYWCIQCYCEVALAWWNICIHFYIYITGDKKYITRLYVFLHIHIYSFFLLIE